MRIQKKILVGMRKRRNGRTKRMTNKIPYTPSEPKGDILARHIRDRSATTNGCCPWTGGIDGEN